MYMMKIVIAVSNTAQPIIPDNAGVRNSHTRFTCMIVQYNGANTMYLGDPSVSTTNSLVLTSGASVGGIQAFNGPGNLLDFFVYGTAADYLNIMVLD